MKARLALKIFAALALLRLDAWCALNQIETRNMLNHAGLLTTTVNDLAQDADGFIWIATPYGLYRHDGVEVWKYFDHGDSSGISSNLIGRVAADTINNKVWIGTNLAGICVFDCKTETFARYRHSDNDSRSISSDIIRDIVVGDDGAVWIATDKGVDKYDFLSDGFVKYNASTVKGFPHGGVNRVLPDGGRLWIGHSSRGLYLLDPDSQTLQSFATDGQGNALSSNAVLSLCRGSGDQLWVGTIHGVSLVDTQSGRIIDFNLLKHIHGSISTYIFDIARTSDGYIWVGTASDLCYFHESDLDDIIAGRRDVWHTFIRDYQWGIANPTVYALLEDKYGNLWAGSNGGGASFLDRGDKQFSSWRIDKIAGVTNGLNDKEIMAICLPDDDTVVMGTDGGGININVKGENKIIMNPDNSGLSSFVYHNILQDADGRMLMTWFNGIDVLDQSTRAVSRIPAPRAGYVNAMMIDADGLIWLGYNDEGLFVIDRDGKKVSEYNSRTSALPRRGITALMQDADNNVWIGTSGYGLYILDNELGEIYKPDFFDRHCTVNHIVTDSKGVVWIATDIGLVSICDRPMQARIYDEGDGMECPSAFSIVEDADANIWMSTNIGLSCLERESGRFRNFGTNDGVLPGPYLRHSCARKSDGTILMGGMNGVCYFNESILGCSEQVPLPRFTSFTILGDQQPSDRHIPIGDGDVTLDFDQNTFSVTFSVMNRALADRCVYAYCMEGLSNDWISLGHESKISFHNLPTGKYRLLLKAKLANGDWPEEYSRLNVRVKSSPWLSPLAKGAYALLAVALILALAALRRHLIDMKRRHKEMAAEVTKSKDIKKALIDSSLTENDRAFAESLIKIIETRLEDEKLDVNEIARQMGLSYSSLYRRVKAISGGTVSDFIKRVRLHNAEQLLLSGRYSISEITRMVGLSSVSYFRDCFKREFGLSPTQWLKTIKSPSAQQKPGE